MINILKSRQLNSKVSFGTRFERDAYRQCYLESPNYNGKIPDSFVINRLQANFPKASGVNVLDIGAGQGRNTIPIAKMGYNVASYELSSSGVISMAQRVKEGGLAERVYIVNKNVLDHFSLVPKFDFAFMSHVSQHFSLSEMEELLKNVYKTLNDKREFVFDALIRNKGVSESRMAKLAAKVENAVCETMQQYGAENFDLQALTAVIKKTGFELVDNSKFKETGKGRALYEKQRPWGRSGARKIFDNMLGIKKLPVELRWLTLRK